MNLAFCQYRLYLLIKLLCTLLVVLFSLQISAAPSTTLDTVDTPTLPREILKDVVTISSRFSNLATQKLPYQIQSLNQDKIRQSSSIGLDELLREQGNIYTAGSPGSLINGSYMQMMGLGPAYIQIVEDNQPLIGREAGSMNLQRIPSFFIQKMEIVKGSMSMTYGDNAIAGVISISTTPSDYNKIEASSIINSMGRYTFDVGGNVVVNDKNKFNISLGYDGFGGYDANPEIIGNQIDPYNAFSGRMHWIYSINRKHTISVIARAYKNDVEGPYLNIAQIFHNQSSQQDYNISVRWKYSINNKLDLQATAAKSGYQSWFQLSDPQNNQIQSKSTQNLDGLRSTLMLRWNNVKNGTFTIGSDIDLQDLASTRYLDNATTQNIAIYTQQEWISKSWTITGGLRLDIPSGFTPQITPKIGVQYAYKKWTFNASVGAGYRTPDLRQRFLFFNHNELGYYVIGSDIIKKTLETQFNIDVNRLPQYISDNQLAPETSITFQTGITFKPSSIHEVKIWLFRNNISGLIQTYLLPINTANRSSIYSYRNLDNVYTQGIDLSYKYDFHPSANISILYSFLQAKEPAVEKKIAEGNVFARNELGSTYRIKPNQYIGLFQRPQHLLTVQSNGSIKNWFNYQISFRLQTGVGWIDKNGSTYFDDPSELAPNLYNLDLSFSKRFPINWKAASAITVKAGAKNILNQVYADYWPTTYGINFYLNMTFTM